MNPRASSSPSPPVPHGAMELDAQVSRAPRPGIVKPAKGEWAWVLLAILSAAWLSPRGSAQIAINLGEHNLNSLQTNRTIVIPIVASGSERISDMSVVLQVGDGGAQAGGTAGPLISEVSLTNSVWRTLAGGIELFPPALPAQTVRFSVAAVEAGATVPANGELFRIVVDASGFDSGEFELKLSGAGSGRTAFYRSGAEVASVLVTGRIRIAPPAVTASPILSLRRLGGGWQLAFTGESGFLYRVQWTPSLIAGSWQTAATNFPGRGQDITWTDDGALTGGPSLRQKFYRLLRDVAP